MKKAALGALVSSSLLFSASIAHAALPNGFLVKIEDAGVTETSAAFDYVGVETFDNRGHGVGSFNTNFGMTDANGADVITANYNNVNIKPHDQFGGAGAAGNYAVSGLNYDRTYDVTFTQTGQNGINYFGYWLSALDVGNTLEFWSGGEQLGIFNPSDVLSLVGGSANNPYYGNPFTQENKGEPYVFVNFFLEEGTFDRIVFRQAAGSAGYESDNHTVGWYKDTGGGTVVPGVPEPATWMTMIAGFGLVGYSLRRRQRPLATQTA